MQFATMRNVMRVCLEVTCDRQVSPAFHADFHLRCRTPCNSMIAIELVMGLLLAFLSRDARPHPSSLHALIVVRTAVLILRVNSPNSARMFGGQIVSTISILRIVTWLLMVSFSAAYCCF